MRTMGSASENLVIGDLGEVGMAIAAILGADGIDKGDIAPRKTYEFLHICIPYSEDFVNIVRKYQLLYSPDHTIIHSTVPLGTSRKLNSCHSPIRGRHPDLEKSIRTFVKYFGGEDAYVCSQIFKNRGIKVKCLKYSQESEALKLYDTLQYGINILLEKEIHQYCERNGLDFDMVYTHANSSYNAGYEELELPQFKKYILEHHEGPINGHCIIPNAYLLDTPFAKLLHAE